MRIGINVLWLKHKKVGGIESYLFNLLDGIFNIDDKNEYILIVSNENKKLFKKYLKNRNVKIEFCNIESDRIIKRILLENFIVDRIAKKKCVNIMFNPVYSKPIFTFSKIPYVTTIHDLQALHYPEYFSKKKEIWLKFAWKNAVNTSAKVIAISDFVRTDILDKFKVDHSKVCTIYNPIKIDEFKNDFNNISKEYNIEEYNYYYSVSSMYKHKNLITLLKVMKILKDRYPENKKKLVISGISGNLQEEFQAKVKELGIEDRIITTGFISDLQRNILYKNCSLFLFPSIFEGFGMPPIEAMMLGKTVITTNRTSIKEVTMGLATYVDDPFDEYEWITKIIKYDDMKDQDYNIKEYEIEKVALEYINIFKEVFKSRGGAH